MSSPNGGMTVEDIWVTTSSTMVVAWSKTTRRMRVVGGVFLFFMFLIKYSFHSAVETFDTRTSLTPLTPRDPKVTLDYGASTPSQFNQSKVALLIENRVNPILSPLVLHFMSVVPPEWRFRFMGSLESVAHMNASRAIRQHVKSGKLDLTYIPANMSTGSQEEISRFLTNLWLYETVLQPAEWLLVFQTDSMLCANSRQSLNNWLDYDWVGAPWNPNGKFGGNGGLSLRRVSTIIDILRNQVRVDDSEAEDVGQGERVAAEKKKGKGADGTKAGGLIKGIDDWRDGFYEPMGYHTGGSGVTLHAGIWGTPEKRKHIWDYCPEVKMIFKMDAAKYVPGDCNSNWKRWDMGQEGVDQVDENVEIIDGVEYPMLPAGLTPW
ncbi:hypothetical protein H4I96_02686 [Botrytis cinerea]